MKKLTFLILTLATTLTLNAQVAINNDASTADNSAMLDVKSTNRGMLVPRMLTEQRFAISSPVNGLLVYDLNTQSFWYFQNSSWKELKAGNVSLLSDADADTKITVEALPDEDIIRFYSNNDANETFRIDSCRFEPNGSGLFIGRGAGGPGVKYENLVNLAIGDSALAHNTSGIVPNNNESFSNSAIGYRALYSNISGADNTAIGKYSLYSNIIGNYNTAYGPSSLSSNVSGGWNTAIGINSLMFNDTGDGNTAVGLNALYSDSKGSYNTAVGTSAGNGYSWSFNDSISNNSLFGYQAGYVLETGGDNNTFLGYRSGFNNTTGHSNVAVGFNAGNNLLSGNNNIIVGGNTIYFPDAEGSNQLNIGNLIYGIDVDGTENTISTGNVGIGIQYPLEKLHVAGKIRMDSSSSIYWTTFIDYWKDYNFAYYDTIKSFIKDTDGSYNQFSDRRLKANIKPLSKSLLSILSLQPVTYHFISDKSQEEKIGLIAQDVEKLFPQAVSEKDGYKSLNYAVFGVIAIEAVKEQQLEIENQQLEIAKQNELIVNLIKRIENLEKQIANK